MKVDDYLQDRFCDCRAKRRPEELMAHVRKLGESCEAHRIVRDYLSYLYANFLGDKIDHIALYHNNTREYRRANGVINDRILSVIEKLKEENKKMDEKVEKLRQMKEENSRMEALNKDLHAKLQALEDVKKELDIKDEEEGKVEPEEILRYKKNFETILKPLKTLWKEGNDTKIAVHVSSKFSLQTFLDEWYDKSPSSAYRSCLFDSDKSTKAMKQTMVRDWDIHFGGGESMF